MALNGDFSKFGQLQKHLEELSRVPSQAAKDVAGDITKLLQQEFKQGTDSYGKPWKPLKLSTLKKGRHPPPLTDTGRLRDGTVATPMQGAGVQIVVGESYGVFHQTGTSRMAARPILPSGVMPKAWAAAIRSVTSKLIKRTFSK